MTPPYCLLFSSYTATFYDFRCFSPVTDSSFYSGYGEIFSGYYMRRQHPHYNSAFPSLYSPSVSLARLCIFFLTSVTADYTDWYNFLSRLTKRIPQLQLIFQHDRSCYKADYGTSLVCSVSQVFSFRISGYPCNDTGDLFPAIFCKISCHLMQIVCYGVLLYITSLYVLMLPDALPLDIPLGLHQAISFWKYLSISRYFFCPG